MPLHRGPQAARLTAEKKRTMKRFLAADLSPRTRVFFSAILLVAVAFGGTRCSSTTYPSSGGCQVITGNTTTTFSAAGGSASISVNTAPNCAWGAVSNVAFISITQGASGAGDGTIVFAVAPNSGPQRSGIVTVTDTATAYVDTTIAITQSAP